MLIFIPVGGLANRMRVIDSAIHLCHSHSMDYTIFWVKDHGLNCSFSSIWKPLDNMKETRFRLFSYFMYLRQKSGILRCFIKIPEKLNYVRLFGHDEHKELYGFVREPGALQRYRHCVIESLSSFYPPAEFQENLFILQPEIKKKVDHVTSSFDKNTIGVHIRRTDHVKAIMNSPTKLFIEKMKSEIEAVPSTRFYLASDSSDIKSIMKKEFGDRVILSEGVLNRHSKEGILEAVLEIYSLSKTARIFGSYYSSYSEMAAKLGKIKLEVLKK
jgi:hypothetical protein